MNRATIPPRVLGIAFVRYGALLVLALAGTAGQSQAAEPEYLLRIKDHRFEPAELRVPANTRVRLVVHNTDATAEEFESHTLNREKLIAPGAKSAIYIGPLKPGRYDFFGEFNPSTAQGSIVAE